jgi:2-C-methyl-D-erythritol 2,4-cyclodiphosphate synthase
MIRIGQGFDVHAFIEGRPLILGGVQIPYEKGLAGHSDADVLIHAICDALLGAAALGDIGIHFPPGESHTKNIDSRKILEYTTGLLHEKGFMIINLDATVICQSPKVSPYRELMREEIHKITGLPVERISIKGTTTEKLGFTGRKEGIAAMAVALLEEK